MILLYALCNMQLFRLLKHSFIENCLFVLNCKKWIRMKCYNKYTVHVHSTDVQNIYVYTGSLLVSDIVWNYIILINEIYKVQKNEHASNITICADVQNICAYTVSLLVNDLVWSFVFRYFRLRFNRNKRTKESITG